MAFKHIYRRAGAVLFAAVLLGLSGCGLTAEQVLNVVAPTQAPTASPETFDYMNAAPEAEPLLFTCTEQAGVLSPFWAATDGDKKIVELTQLSLLAVEGSQSPSEVSRAANADGSVTVTVKLRDDIRFSDGEAVTADDLLFTYYVLLDPDYDGPLTVNTLPIRGLADYWNGMDTDMFAKYVVQFDEVYNAGKYDEDLQNALKDAQNAARSEGVAEDDLADDAGVKDAQKALDEYDTEKAQEIKDAVELYWRRDAQAMVDYCMENYAASIEMKIGYTREEVEQSAGLQVAFAMVDTSYGTLGADGVLTGRQTGTTWDLETAFPTTDDFYAELYDAYGGDAELFWSIEGYGRRSMLELAQNAVISAWAKLDPDWKGETTRVSGLERVDAHTLTVTLEYCDDAVLRTLCQVYVAPLHVYGQRSLFLYASDSFGFTRGDLSAVRACNGLSLGAGAYVYSERVGRTVYLTANEGYWLGTPEAPGVELTAQ